MSGAKSALRIGRSGLRVVALDFVDGFVFLVQVVDQVVGLHKLIAHIGADEVSLRDGQADGIAAIGEPGEGLLEDRPGQHKSCRLAADLAPAHAVVADPMQILQRQILLGDADELQIIADQRLDQHNLGFLHMVAKARLLFGWQRVVALKLLEEDFQGRHLRVQAQHLLGGRAALEHLARDLLEELMAQVVGEVEFGQLIPDDGQPALPHAADSSRTGQ